MNDKMFVDSNVWLYTFLADNSEKSNAIARYMVNHVETPIVISYQVINEVTVQLLRKKYSNEQVNKCIELLFKFCRVHNFSKNVIMLASTLRQRYSLSFWDSLIVASALDSGCNILVTEDMQDGLQIENMVIRNIIKDASKN